MGCHALLQGIFLTQGSNPRRLYLQVGSLPLDFPGGSDGKASVYNAGDLGSIPGSGRSAGERNGIHSSTIAWKIPWGRKESDTTERVHFPFLSLPLVPPRKSLYMEYTDIIWLKPDISGRRKWQPTPGFLPGESHGQRSLAGYCLWSHMVGHD